MFHRRVVETKLKRTVKGKRLRNSFVIYIIARAHMGILYIYVCYNLFNKTPFLFFLYKKELGICLVFSIFVYSLGYLKLE